MTAAIAVCGVASLVHLFKNRPAADRLAVSAAELAVLFGAMGLVTGPLWGRKAWGVWWQWDARLTMALLLELVFISYLLVRAYGGPGSDKLAAAVGLFGMAVSPFVYVSVNIWRTVHPLNTVVPRLIGGSMPGRGHAVRAVFDRLSVSLRAAADAARQPGKPAGARRRAVSGRG